MTGMNADPTPPPVTRDASQRAFRTLLQGAGVSVAGAMVVAAAAAIAPGIHWTLAYWAAFALALANAAIMAIVSYFSRILFPPSNTGGA